MREFKLHDGTDVAKLFIDECSMYPTGHVAHSIRRVECIPNVFADNPIGESDRNNGLNIVIQGISIPTDDTHSPCYFSVAVDEQKFLNNGFFRIALIDDHFKYLAIYWKQRDVSWWAMGKNHK